MSAALRQRLARPGLARLWDELIRRWESSDRPVTTVALRGLTDSERHAVADLLETDRLPDATCTVAVRRIVERLGVTIDDLKAALVELRGPWRSRAAERELRAREREDLWSWVSAEAMRLGVAEWSERVRARGVIGGDANAFRARLARALWVLERLPGDQVPLAGLACDVLGDPHALDHGTWLGSVVLDALAQRHRVPVPASAEDARRLWSLAGVVADGLSSSVLCLGLAPTGADPLAKFLQACASAAEPAAVTMSQLQKWPCRQRAPIVFAFENPSILAEAAHADWRGPPLVCTSGWPNVAAITLLRQVIADGARVLYHGDFDPKGVAIAQMLIERLGVEAWRMCVAEYERDVARGRVQIVGEIPVAGWDAALAPSMRRHRLAVFEEDVRQDLLAAVLSE
jgi:uncharacterized protein (TIGR02679 family)